MSVPVFTLDRARERVEAEVKRRWDGVLASTGFVNGAETQEFERRFADYLGAAGCVGVGNGTDALILSLRALGVKPGDEVLVPAFSFFASAEAVLLVGARPVFVDIDPCTFNLDPDELVERVTARTVGIIGVHLYGRPFAVDRVLELCSRRGIWLLEDAAQAHGARFRGQRVGSFGQLAGWSFYPSKNLGCFGDGGAVSGSDAELLESVRLHANHGQTGRYVHSLVGTNSRLDGLQAAVLNARLARLDEDNRRRRAIAVRYRRELSDLAWLVLPEEDDDVEPVYHQFTVRTPQRGELQRHLAAAGVGSSVHYPQALHRVEALAGLWERPPELPQAERAAREVLCLPIFPELEDAEIDLVVSAVHSFAG